MDNLAAALNQGVDTGLTISEVRETWCSHMYAGFPHSLNALGVLMKVVETRKQACLQDTEDYTPSRPVHNRRRVARCRHGEPDEAVRRPGERGVVPGCTGD